MKKRVAMLAILVAGLCSTPSWAIWVLNESGYLSGIQGLPNQNWCVYKQTDPHAAGRYAGYWNYPATNWCPGVIKGSSSFDWVAY